MFYTANSLRRGGRFYLCWIADTWPLRFAAIPSRQIMLLNIPKICDELREVVATESGYPHRRYSLRLSIRLVHGLVRVHNRQCTIVLGNLFHMYTDIYRMCQRRAQKEQETAQPRRKRRIRRVPAIEQPPQIEELAPSVQPVDEQMITLREEPVLPPHPAPANDGFAREGEPPEQLLQSLEMMMAPERPDLLLQSLETMLAPEPAANLSTDRSLSVRAPRPAHLTRVTASPQPETDARELGALSRTLDVTNLLGKDTTAEQPPDATLPPPASPAAVLLSPRAHQVPAPPLPAPPPPPPLIEEPLILPELEVAVRRVRARRRRLVIDKYIKLSTEVMHNQLREVNNIRRVLLVDTHWVQGEDTLRMSTHGWRGNRPVLSPSLVALYSRNLARVANNFDTKNALDERRQAPPPPPPPAPPRKVPPPPPLAAFEVHAPLPTLEFEPQPPQPNLEFEPQPPRQALEFEPQLPQPNLEFEPQPPRQTLEFEPQLPQPNLEFEPQPPQPAPEIVVLPPAPECGPHPPPQEQEQASLPGPSGVRGASHKRRVSTATQPPPADPPEQKRRKRSEEAQITVLETSEVPEAASLLEPVRRTRRSETPLGSLDRTRVSLGVPSPPSPSRAALRLEWGAEGTMLKITSALRANVHPLSVEVLVDRAPRPPPHIRLAEVVARCFSSVLKLKQAGFLKITKDPNTLAITHMELADCFQTP